MKFVNTADLKQRTNKLLHEVRKGQTVIVTYHGKPVVGLVAVTENGLEDLLFEQSAVLKQVLREGLEDLKKGRTMSLKAYVRGRFGAT